ncbi:Hypothetical predicted protein [Mytilus galloprovincialis]|uniref:KY-like immunoglobulin-like domain-containing protein n=1 Tax=Mytilus galloprovincialis TaxID=29158 RepID=A0A8B6E0S4_MYTGA|nr:Hypothetical predicted protein [Mytilus galloprovincialis]
MGSACTKPNSKFIPFENDSDEVRIPPEEDGYPDPRVVYNITDKSLKRGATLFADPNPNTGSESAGRSHTLPMTKAELDKHAKKTPKSALNSFDDLIAYLEKPLYGKASRDEVMVRALLVWLSNQKIENFKSKRGRTDTPRGFLSLLGQDRTTYSTVFTVLCRKANIKCAQIHGVCKAGNYQPGDRDNRRSQWNAVYLNDSWHVIHPYWVCRAVVGLKAGGWIKLEKGGKSVVKRQKADSGVVQNAFQEQYIMPDPIHFLYECHPDDKKWQLVQKPITREQFFDQAYLRPAFWELGMKLLSVNACALKTTGNATAITFQAPKDTANELNMDYEFLIKEGSSNVDEENKMLKAENMPRLVAKIRNGSEWNFHIQFPIEGIYKIIINGAPEYQHLTLLCEFQITCTEKSKDCRLTPFDPGLLGFGPGQTCEKAGLLLPSHQNGLVTTEKSKPIRMSFLLDSEVSKSLKVKTELVNADSEGLLLQQSDVTTIIEKTELKIITKVVREGDYGLKIFTGSNTSSMSVVCNYFITTSYKFTYEKTNKRLARQNLLSCIENSKFSEIEKIEQGISRCIKEKIPETDSDIENAHRKVEVLKIKKDIHDAYMRRHLLTTETTILKIQQSQYIRIFTESVQHLEEYAFQLRNLEGFTQELPDILAAVGEFNHAHVTNETVVNTLVALSVLFGNKPKPIENKDDLPTLARDTKHKIQLKKDNIASSLSIEDARHAQVVIERYTYKQTRNVNVAAASIHRWVTDVASTLISGRSEGDV